MKTILEKLSNEKAQKEVGQFTYWALGASIVSLVIFWWLAIIGLGAGVRGFLLTYHKGNQKREDLQRLRLMSGAAVIVSVLTIILYTASN